MLVLVTALEITVEQSPLPLQMFLQGHLRSSSNMAQKRLVFTSTFSPPWHNGMAHAVFPTRLHSFRSPNRYERTTALIGDSYAADG